MSISSTETDFYRHMHKLAKNTQEALREMDADSEVCMCEGWRGWARMVLLVRGTYVRTYAVGTCMNVHTTHSAHPFLCLS